MAVPGLGVYKNGDNHKETPTDLLEDITERFEIDFDPCPFHSEFDGLSRDWGRSNFVNPPYDNLKEWIKKGLEQMAKGKRSYFLVPFRPQARYWQAYVLPRATDIFFFEGIAFPPFTKEIPITLCLVEFDPQKKPRFASDFLGNRRIWYFDQSGDNPV